MNSDLARNVGMVGGAGLTGLGSSAPKQSALSEIHGELEGLTKQLHEINYRLRDVATGLVGNNQPPNGEKDMVSAVPSCARDHIYALQRVVRDISSELSRIDR